MRRNVFRELAVRIGTMPRSPTTQGTMGDAVNPANADAGEAVFQGFPDN
jgi:hypothetical protein